MRRLPVYIAIDSSGSMRGEPIAAVNNGLGTMISALRQDPQALENVHLCLIKYDIEAQVIAELTPLEKFVLNPIETPRSGPTHLGEALELVLKRVAADVVRSTPEKKGDYAPILFVMTDGKPSDTQAFDTVCPKISQAGFANVIGCAAGPKAEATALERFCNHVVTLDTMDSAGFQSFFQWVSEAITTGSRSGGSGGEPPALPPPPDEINVVL